MVYTCKPWLFYPPRAPQFTQVFWWGPCCSSFFFFLFFFVGGGVLFVSLRSDVRIKTMFGSSLPPVVCRRDHVLFMLFVFVWAQWCPTHILLCFCFVGLFSSCVLYIASFSGLFISPSVFSTLPFSILYSPLQYSLLSTSVFSTLPFSILQRLLIITKYHLLTRLLFISTFVSTMVYR